MSDDEAIEFAKRVVDANAAITESLQYEIGMGK